MIHTYIHIYQDFSRLVLRVDRSTPNPTLECLTPIDPANVAEHRRFMHEVVMRDLQDSSRPDTMPLTPEVKKAAISA